MCEPYSDEYYAATGEEKGLVPLLWNEKNLMESMEKVQAAGFNIHVHAMGDYAAKYTVHCFINAQDKYNKDGKLRNIIAHCYYVKPEDKVRMGENGIIASIQPQSLWLNMAVPTGINCPVLTKNGCKQVQTVIA